MEKIKQFYNEEYDEWQRLERHKVEFDVTKRYIDTYVPESPCDIIDIGGGPGRYSFYLAAKGHRVTLFDLSERHLKEAKKREAEYTPIEEYVCGDILTAKFSKQYDIVLLMGPLYHLIEENERKLAVEKAMGALKGGGILFASFISNYAPMIDMLTNYTEALESKEQALRYLTDGENATNGFTTAYFTGMDEAEKMMEQSGLHTVEFIGVETLMSFREERLKTLDQETYQNWLDVCFALGKDEAVKRISEHYLYIGRKDG